MEAVDLGVQDPLTWTLDGAPPDMSISSEGIITYTTQESDLGSWRVRVTVTDDSGEWDSAIFYLSVEQTRPDEDVGLGCCCFGATAATALPLWMLFGPRRRRLLG